MPDTEAYEMATKSRVLAVVWSTGGNGVDGRVGGGFLSNNGVLSDTVKICEGGGANDGGMVDSRGPGAIGGDNRGA